MSSGKLFVVATPIGNLGDMTYRAVEILQSCSLILAEDTRETKKLLNHFNIKKEIVSSHKFNEKKQLGLILSRLENGDNLALVSDAGTPLMSDPGFVAVEACIEKGIEIIPVPGASSLLSAAVVSGFDTGQFIFFGFLSKKPGQKKKDVENIKTMSFPVIVFESPKRVKATLELLLEVLGDIKISVSKEITKIYEKTFRGKIAEVIPQLTDNLLKGEFVIVLSSEREGVHISEESVSNLISELIIEGMTKSAAVKEAAERTGMNKNAVYKIALKVKEDEQWKRQN